MNFSHTAVHMNFCSQMQEKMMCFFFNGYTVKYYFLQVNNWTVHVFQC